jgi:sarcosine oxidase, subunit beta
MTRYSAFALIRRALSHHEHWPTAWRSPEPKGSYDTVIVGAGGHGLATAFNLAEKPWRTQCRDC